MKTEKQLLHKKIQISVFVFILIRTLSVFADVEVSLKFDPKRGSPAEYDAGAPVSSKWLELFGSTPNYRAIGIETLKGQAKLNEKFRWEFGPMWYRGRLTPESVKVFIVGQEGAQDENISNRAFTGSTGTRVQKFLNHLGIYRSYLFMNTFVYTINGQLEDDPKFKWIEQGETSPIVDYRHKLFDYMLETNSQTISLFIGVGRGGKSSLATWINARGGKCSVAFEMANCDTSGMVAWFAQHRNLHIKNNIVAVGVPHPGGANPNLGGDAQLENIRKGFTQAAQRVAAYKTKNKNWLTKDIDEKLSEDDLVARLNKPYVYRGYAPIPFRDFAFNTNWRMGSQGTTSNRWGSSSIQIYSDLGVYNEKKSTYKRPRDLDSGLNSTKTALLEMSDRDLAYESPRFNKNTSYVDYDFGPCGYLKFDQKPCELAEALVSWPDLKQQGINFISHESFGYSGTYRGHAKNARIFIIADQTSHDDMFSTRALTGTSGQKLQQLLYLSGVGSNYFIQRTFPVDTLGLETHVLIQGATQTAMLKTYQRIYEVVKVESQLQAIIAIGPVAQAIVEKLDLKSSLPVYSIDSMDDKKAVNITLNELSLLLTGVKSSVKYNGELRTIPREDLPYHTRWWMGSSGDRAARGESFSVGNYYRVWAPYWVSNLMPMPLSEDEKINLHQLLNNLTTP